METQLVNLVLSLFLSFLVKSYLLIIKMDFILTYSLVAHFKPRGLILSTLATLKKKKNTLDIRSKAKMSPLSTPI